MVSSMKRVWGILLSAALCLGILSGCNKPADPSSSTMEELSSTASTEDSGVVYDKGDMDETTTPVLKIRVNETYWKYVDLTEYLGQDNAWIRTDIDMKYLTQGINQIALNSNTYSYGNKTEKSLDIYYSLCSGDAFDTFISEDVMNTWDVLSDRYANITLELQNAAGEWETISYNSLITQDDSVVVGTLGALGLKRYEFKMKKFVNSMIFIPNLTVESLEGYTAARVAVNLHVGSDLMQEPEPEAPDEEDPGDPLDDVAPVLKVKLNNTIWARLDLTNYAGKDDVWVTVPLNFEKMKAGNNRITVDSNVYNTADFSSHSADLYFTSSIKGDSAVSSDGMVYWEPISDRVCNIALELRDRETGEWIRPEEETFGTDTHTVIGTFNGGDYQTTYNMRRTFFVDSLDQYDDVRAAIHLHVGKNVAEKEDVQEPDVPSPLDTTVPVLKLNVNGSAYERVDLTPVLGQENTWVTVPVDFAKLRTGLNRIIVDSNVDNVSNFSDNSLDLYFTDSTKGDSAVSTDGMVNWMDIDNRVCNISLELRNASSGNWEKVTKEEFNTFEHTVIGQFSANAWMEQYNMRRSFQIDNLERYNEARVLVNLHVGSDLKLK